MKRVAYVTGGMGGIGTAICRKFHDMGYLVIAGCGPTRDHEIAFVFTRAGLPVEITAESDNWRRIRDWEGSEGWVYHSLLSGKRTALVSAKQPDDLVPLYDRADTAGALVARLQPGVLATVKHCSGTWCHISGQGFDGFIAQDRLWGVYPNEKIE